jgi:hypothetical protein
MPPIVEFGSPVQRAKSNEKESFWHIPVTIYPRLWKKFGPATLYNCAFYLEEYDGDAPRERIRLYVGDWAFENPVEIGHLEEGKVLLIPVVWRSEEKGEGNAYIADSRFFVKNEFAYPVPPDRKIHRYRLSVVSGKFTSESSHFYRLRIPQSSSNGHFVLELEYKGRTSR